MGVYKPGRPRKYNPGAGAGQKPPAEAGEYRIRGSDGKVTYIGETCNLRRRIDEHIRSGKLPADGKAESTVEYQVADGRSSSRTRRSHEQEKIARHTPPLNKSKGGEGRIAGK